MKRKGEASLSPFDIKELRKRLGLTQREMAEKLGVTRICLTQWERGVHEPNPLNLERLQALFNGEEIAAKRPHPLDDPTVRRIFKELMAALGYYYKGRAGEAK